jgi:hypothetical protein
MSVGLASGSSGRVLSSKHIALDSHPSIAKKKAALKVCL